MINWSCITRKPVILPNPHRTQKYNFKQTQKIYSVVKSMKNLNKKNNIRNFTSNLHKQNLRQVCIK